MNLKKSVEQKPVKIINKKGKANDDKNDHNGPLGIQYVEKPEYTGK